MPGFNKTGPQGQGPMTGGGRGPCGAGRGPGGGQGRGRGQGMGRGRGGRGAGGGQNQDWGPSTTGTNDEVARLREQSNQLKSQLEQIANRLAELQEK